MERFKIRASGAGKIMTNARKKTEILGETAKTYAKDWLIEQIYGVRREFSSKYTDKGNGMEDAAIAFAIKVLGLPFTMKNEESFSNDYMTGTPDLILDNEVLDIKCSWEAYTFPILEDKIPTKEYADQLQVYMALTGKKKARLVYVLLNTPEELGGIHTYDHVPDHLRIKTFDVEYDQERVDAIIERVEEVRNYLKSIEI